MRRERLHLRELAERVAERASGKPADLSNTRLARIHAAPGRPYAVRVGNGNRRIMCVE